METLRSRVPDSRVLRANRAGVNGEGEFVLYWMIAARRTEWNFALQRAVEWARELGRPLVILEALRAGYRWASDRLHTFVLQGMADNARRLEGRPVSYFPYVEPRHGEGKGLLETLARQACVVVTDRYPATYLPRMAAAAGRRLAVRLEEVDNCGLLPLSVTAGRAFPTAFAFRRVLQQELPGHLEEMPLPDPLEGVDLPQPPTLPEEITGRWPAAEPALLEASSTALAGLEIDHSVPPFPGSRGGTTAGRELLARFLRSGLARYAEHRNHPAETVTSGLAPYLRFGHVSSAEVFTVIVREEGWRREDLGEKASGRRAGWWGMSPGAEGFLDQLVTWRELGYSFAAVRPDWEEFESLPPWARNTLDAHAADPRPHRYTLQQFAAAATHDPLWNAAQRQLLCEGTIHNYLRMVWGKKILEWSESPAQALEWMLELNNRYALDGRDPNSTSGITWCMGRFDRPWGPERPIFGTVRYMSSENTMRKLRLGNYLERFGE